MERIGLFLCTGCDIGKAIRAEGLEELAEEHGASTTAAHPCLCSPEGLTTINKAVEDGAVDGLVIAACSARQKAGSFRFDPTKVAVERVSLREQVAWSQKHGEEDTQMLAEDLLRMSLARVSKMSLTQPLQETVERTVLVVGGGLAGLEAARAVAGMGHRVVLVERMDRLGGYLIDSKDLTPDGPPYDKPHPNRVPELVEEVEADPEILVFRRARIRTIKGQPGQFHVEVDTPSGPQTFEAGAIVQATGAEPYDASKLSHLGYGNLPDVVTSSELEKMLIEGKLVCPSDGREPERIVFIQCAGSRDERHLPYCSTECCQTTLKQVSVIHRDFPEVECAVVYRDLRAPAQLERFYAAVQEQTKALFTRGEVERIQGTGSGRLRVELGESLLGEGAAVEADLVVLAVGMVPQSADGEAIRALTDAKARLEKAESETQKVEVAKLVEALKEHEGREILNLEYRQGPDMPVLEYSFADSHYICFPYETRRTGVYAAGTVRAPMYRAQAAEDGWGAAMKAVQCINAAARGETVHPRAGDRSIADFFLQRCTQCKRCTEECPFGTLNEDEKGTPQYNPLRCRRCGICLGACPERIISFPEYSVDAVAGMIKAIDVPEEDEEKPRMIALMCENDALPALDEAAAQRKTWSPWIRVIPVRCLGAVNVVWIADALSRGIDGVILIGCRKGENYQCHYIRGSELAAKRLENVQETLERLTLEPERVKIVELARNELHRIPEIFEEFAETIEEVGPNPYKGF